LVIFRIFRIALRRRTNERKLGMCPHPKYRIDQLS
jgi:hypothetical protein